ncbi:hypothetical protein [Lentzea sp. NEAU-D7]|uniref:hypothetical protein n=1 Tax=Lentzea sp. NEAU-D7 TaxID=2994667 RepID=UPI003A4C7A12
MFHDIAKAWWADVLFMAGLLAIGVAPVLGVGLLIAAAAGAVMMLLMWVAEWPPRGTPRPQSPRCRPTRSSTTTWSTPSLLIAVAAAAAAATWARARWWNALPVVEADPWLR